MTGIQEENTFRNEIARAAATGQHDQFRILTDMFVQWLEERDRGEEALALAKPMLARELVKPPTHWPTIEQLPDYLSAHQKSVLQSTLIRRVAILNGSPGTGKTRCLSGVVSGLRKMPHLGHRIAVVAPTGKAAVRATEAMMDNKLRMHASTIHQLLQIQRNGHDGNGWSFGFNRNNYLPVKFLIVEEASMLDVDLADSLFSACSPGTHILLIGDLNQLPPVGHGAVLRDLIASGVPCGELTEIYRNAGAIVRVCASIKNGEEFEVPAEFDPHFNGNLRHIEARTPAEAKQSLLKFLGTTKQDFCLSPVWDTQVVTALNSRSELSKEYLNALLQAQLNPDSGSGKIRSHDKVICTRNSWFPGYGFDFDEPAQDREYVANGEIGKAGEHRGQCIVISFPNPSRRIRAFLGKVKDEDGNEVEAKSDIELAYAVTVHKVQGSEFPIVIVMLDDSFSARQICTREWLYTALSRAKKWCVTIGKKEVLMRMARQQSLDRRKTFLTELITGKVKPIS